MAFVYIYSVCQRIKIINDCTIRLEVTVQLHLHFFVYLNYIVTDVTLCMLTLNFVKYIFIFQDLKKFYYISFKVHVSKVGTNTGKLLDKDNHKLC